MKNVIAIILGIGASLLLGTLFMDVSTSPKETSSPVIGEVGSVKAFQIGAFSSFDKAKSEAEAKNGIVMSDGEYNYVYVAILSNSVNIEKMINYLDSNNSYYYIKDISLSSENMSELNKYEELMKQTTSEIAFLELNKRFLEKCEVAV